MREAFTIDSQPTLYPRCNCGMWWKRRSRVISTRSCSSARAAIH